ncbi:MAG: EAL domain-containing protein [Rhizobiaceae bacterium]
MSFIGGNILVDETGVETGLWGRFRLKTVFQPVFRLHGDVLTAFAVEGRTLPLLEGSVVPPNLFAASVLPSDRAFLGRLGRMLGVGNLENASSGGLDVFVGLDLDSADVAALPEEVEELSVRLAEAGQSADAAIFVLRGHAARLPAELAGVAETIRSSGMRLCLEGEGPLFPAPDLLSALSPDFLRLDAARLRVLAGDASIRRLLLSMHLALAERGIAVLATGIEVPGDFAATVDAGSACFQGMHLARPALAGSMLSLNPLAVEPLRNSRDNVVPLFG